MQRYLKNVLYSLPLLSKDETFSFFPLYFFLLACDSTFCCRKQRYVLIVKQGMYSHGINHSFSGFLCSQSLKDLRIYLISALPQVLQ